LASPPTTCFRGTASRSTTSCRSRASATTTASPFSAAPQRYCSASKTERNCGRRPGTFGKNQSDYQVGPGRPPPHTRFKKGQSGNPGGRCAKTLPALLAAALDETVYVTTNGRRRKLTKREAIITQMVDKSASADLRATKMLVDMMQEVEHKAGVAAPLPEPRPLAAADKEVVQLFVARLRRQILQEIEEGQTTARPE